MTIDDSFDDNIDDIRRHETNFRYPRGNVNSPYLREFADRTLLDGILVT